MPLEIQTATVQPNTQATFTFSDQIAQRLVGIQAFTLSFGNVDHHVQTMSIALNVNQAGKQLQVTPVATLVDDNGHNMSQSSSAVTVVAMAWVGVNDDNLKLGNASNIANNGSSNPIQIPTPNPSVLQAALAGFNLSYGSSDHHLETAYCAVGTNVSGTSAEITGQALMYDDTGHTAATATVNGGLIANGDTTLPLQVLLTNNLQGTTQTFTFANEISKCYTFLSSFKVQFKKNSDHHVKSIGASLTVQSYDYQKATVLGAASLTDDSGNSQDDGISHVSGFIVGF